MIDLIKILDAAGEKGNIPSFGCDGVSMYSPESTEMAIARAAFVSYMAGSVGDALATSVPSITSLLAGATAFSFTDATEVFGVVISLTHNNNVSTGDVSVSIAGTTPNGTAFTCGPYKYTEDEDDNSVLIWLNKSANNVAAPVKARCLPASPVVVTVTGVDGSTCSVRLLTHQADEVKKCMGNSPCNTGNSIDRGCSPYKKFFRGADPTLRKRLVDRFRSTRQVPHK